MHYTSVEVCGCPALTPRDDGSMCKESAPPSGGVRLSRACSSSRSSVFISELDACKAYPVIKLNKNISAKCKRHYETRTARCKSGKPADSISESSFLEFIAVF